MERQKDLTKYSEWIIYILFFVGAFAHPIEFLKPIMIALTPFTLLITTSIIVLNLLFEKNKKLFFWLTIFFILTMLVEIIGVSTKIIFGNYVYGNVLGLKFFDVPIIIGFNWVLIILGAIQTSQKIFNNNILILLSSSFLTLIFDIVLEPVAIKLNYWSWNNNIIPFQNFIAWFLISFFSVIVFALLKIEIKNLIILKYFWVQFVFFFILQILL